jgi:hypothetical protein
LASLPAIAAVSEGSIRKVLCEFLAASIQLRKVAMLTNQRREKSENFAANQKMKS